MLSANSAGLKPLAFLPPTTTVCLGQQTTDISCQEIISKIVSEINGPRASYLTFYAQSPLLRCPISADRPLLIDKWAVLWAVLLFDLKTLDFRVPTIWYGVLRYSIYSSVTSE